MQWNYQCPRCGEWRIVDWGNRTDVRPVLMVILASGLGMLPMAISRGIGSENRAGIGIASVAGVLVAGFLTMTVLPLIYTLFTGKPKTEHPVNPAGSGKE